MQSPIRTAIVGYGESGRLSHAYGIQANAEFTVSAVCDISEENRRRAATELNCPVYADLSHLLDSEELDLVSIITRSDTHAELACQCLEHGRHVLVTKPWALNAKEASRMIRTARQNDRQIFPWIPVQWAPDFRLARQLLKDNRLGDVFMIRRHLSDFRLRNDWQTLQRFGGGYLLNWGMHVIPPILALADSPLVQLFADLMQVMTPGDTEDHFTIHMKFENGTRGIAEFSKALLPLPALFIQGKRGTISTDADSLTLRHQDSHGETLTEQLTLEGKRFGDEAEIYADIAKTLLNGAPFPVSYRDALAGTIAMDCARESYLSGLPVNVPQADP